MAIFLTPARTCPGGCRTKQFMPEAYEHSLATIARARQQERPVNQWSRMASSRTLGEFLRSRVRGGLGEVFRGVAARSCRGRRAAVVAVCFGLGYRLVAGHEGIHAGVESEAHPPEKRQKNQPGRHSAARPMSEYGWRKVRRKRHGGRPVWSEPWACGRGTCAA